LAFSPTGPVGPIVLNKPARDVLDAYRRPHALDDDTARQLAALRLLAPTTGVQRAIHDTPSTLTAWLHVTNACNLQCDYCYVHQSGQAMTQDTGRAAVDATLRSAQANGYRAVKLKYAGGEPTLNFALVTRLHDYACEQTSRVGLELRETLLSNGVALTDEMIAWLRGEQVRLMISLDGLGANHDVQRHFADGRGTSELVIGAIERALVAGLKPYLSITVSADNARDLPQVVGFALGHGLLFNLNFVRFDAGVTGLRDIIAGVRAAFDVIAANLPPYPLTSILDRANFAVPHVHPCGAGHDYLVIDPSGRVARCQMEFDQSVADVWDDDPLVAVRAASTGFRAVAVDEKDECRDCSWRYACGGGCPLLARRAGRGDRSPYCDAYRVLYPELLKLEGLRLLKFGTLLD
jgi:uncharacterized protein